MFATYRTEEWRTRAVVVIIYDYTWYHVVVPCYLLAPISRENGGTSQDIVDEDSCPENHRDIPGDVIYNVLRFLWSLLPPLASLRRVFIHIRGFKRGLDDRLRG